MSKIHEFNPRIYPRRLWITVGTEDFKDTFEGVSKWEEGDEARVDLVHHIKRNLGGVLIRFQDLGKMTFGTVAHESVHAACCVYDFCGVDIDTTNQEHLAYFVGWIAQCCGEVAEKEKAGRALKQNSVKNQ